jgi:hypothetical protein
MEPTLSPDNFSISHTLGELEHATAVEGLHPPYLGIGVFLVSMGEK